MKLQIKRGLPGSGKTTIAYRDLKTQGNTGRINRDDLRAMLFNSEWSRVRERVIVDCERAIAGVLHDHKMNAIIDDTNLTQGHVDMWKRSAEDIGFKEANVDKLQHNLDAAVGNDSRRIGKQRVGKAIIHRMALMNGLIDFGAKPIVIVDIDGTIADGTHREYLVQQKPKLWKTYFDLCDIDSPVEFVINMVRALAQDHTIVLLSGRPDTTQFQTLDWLEAERVPYEYIFMRSGGDARPDVEVKKDFLDKLPKEQILVVFDDRPCVVRMWRENGVRVIPVRGAIDEF